VTGTKDTDRLPVGALDGHPAQATSPGATALPLTVGTGVLAGTGVEGPLVGPAVAVPPEGLPPALDDPVPAGVPLAVPELLLAVLQPAASAPAASSVAAAAHARPFDPIGVLIPGLVSPDTLLGRGCPRPRFHPSDSFHP
jgi:hypothetical protein